MRAVSWRLAFLRSRSLNRPTGNPLCTYKCTTAEFEAMRSVLQESLGGSLEEATTIESACFVLFGAEWFRREHSGGSWSWNGIFESLDVEQPRNPQTLYEKITDGLRFWEREVVYVGSNRAFLITLAAEGGLPQRLLHEQGAHLRRFFQALLQDLDETADGANATPVSERAQEYLPASFCQEVVYQIAGQLVAEVWKLSRDLGEHENPLAELDASDPTWKDRLPIALADDTARALLKGLVSDAKSLRGRRKRSRVKAETLLVHGPDGWLLERRVSFPPSISEDALAEVVNLEPSELPPRFEISVEAASRREPLALATRESGGTGFRLERARRSVGRFTGDDARHPLQLLAEVGHRLLGKGEIAGSSELSELAWVFAPIGEGASRFRFAGGGACNLREDVAMLVADAGTAIVALGDSTVEECGRVDSIDCTVFVVRGMVRVQTNDAVFTVRTGSVAASSNEYVVRGEVFDLSRGKVPVHLGHPRIFRVDREGVPRRVPPDKLEWKPRGHGMTWKPLTSDCVGAVTIRHSVDEETLYRENFRVLPARARFKMVEAKTTPAGTHAGGWELVGTDAMVVDGVSATGLKLQAEELERCWRVTATALIPAPATLEVEMLWENDCSLSLKLPFPARVVRFLFPDGAEIPAGKSVQWQALSRVRAQAVTPSMDSIFVVSGSLSGSDVPIDLRAATKLESQLHSLGPHVCELELSELARQVELIFASTKDLDAVLRLRIIPKFGSGKYAQRELLVTRFEGRVVRENESLARQDLADQGIMLDVNSRLLTNGGFSLRATGGSLLRLDPSSEHRVEAVALWDPARRVELERHGDAFVLDEELEEGTWVLMGWEGRRARFRPLIFPVESEREGERGLRDACQAADAELRHRLLDQLLLEMAAEPSHDAWDTLLGFFAGARDVPPTTFDVLDRLIECPEAVALCALKMDPESFETMWSMLERLPFSWSVLPVQAWLKAADRFAQTVAGALECLPSELAIRREDGIAMSLGNLFERAPLFLRCMKNVADLVRRDVLQVAPPNSELAFASTESGRGHLIEVLEHERTELRQVHADEHWPQWGGCEDAVAAVRAVVPDELLKPLLSDVRAPWRAPLMLAPIVAAAASAFDVSLSRASVSSLRRLEEFDPRWFERAHAIAHACLCAGAFNGEQL